MMEPADGAIGVGTVLTVVSIASRFRWGRRRGRGGWDAAKKREKMLEGKLFDFLLFNLRARY